MIFCWALPNLPDSLACLYYVMFPISAYFYGEISCLYWAAMEERSNWGMSKDVSIVTIVSNPYCQVILASPKTCGENNNNNK